LDPLTRAFTDTLFIRGKLAIPASHYTVEISDANNNHLWTLEGTPANDRIDTSWDLTDGNGNLIGQGSLQTAFNLYTADQQPPLQVQPAQAIHEDPIPGDCFVVVYGYDSPPAVMNALASAMGQGVVDNLNTGGQNIYWCPDYILTPWGNGPFAHKAYRWYDNPHYTRTILNALTDTRVNPSGNFYWWGHGTAFTIGPFLEGGHQILAADGVTDRLNNRGDRHHIYRLVVLDCCLAYSRDWSEAFGIDYSRCDGVTSHGTTSTSDSYRNDHRQPRAFVGWIPETFVTDSPTAMTLLQAGENLLWVAWQNGDTIQTAVRRYVGFLDSKSEFSKSHAYRRYGISGCWDLTHCNPQN
jgi:hypothetical protein